MKAQTILISRSQLYNNIDLINKGLSPHSFNLVLLQANFARWYYKLLIKKPQITSILIKNIFLDMFPNIKGSKFDVGYQKA